MPQDQRTYIAIDLKSFYASVECVERGLNPLTTNLVVADSTRTDKTICLAVSPALKSFGVPGRPRLFEVVRMVREKNEDRRRQAPQRRLTGSSTCLTDLQTRPDLAIDYLVAPPRMAYYIEYSTRIFRIYLNYVAPEDIHVYSIDEVFIDATKYLDYYKASAHDLTMRIIRDVLAQTGITATAGIGTNLYLCKVAMDIVAKHIPADKDGVRIAQLDEISYRRTLWDHRPLTDFWRVGKGIASKLEAYGIRTMGQVARCSVHSEGLLYRLFGVNAELLIDHAWGWEPCTIDCIKAYKPENNSRSSGQVLQSPYNFAKASIVMKEMVDSMVLELVEKHLVTDQIVITVSYDAASLTDGNYHGATTLNHYGRPVPKHAHGGANLGRHTSSSKIISEAADELFSRIVDRALLIRRLNFTCNHVIDEADAQTGVQLDLFSDHIQEEADLTKERKMQEALIGIKKKYGKNSIVRGIDFEDGATAMLRNEQIGGHKA